MHRKNLLSLFGLKWNPFTSDVPTQALLPTARIESFCRRIENLTLNGGFALVTGDSGNGKSATMRILAQRLASLPEVVVGEMSRPQSGLADFYRELGEVFDIPLKPHNRWGTFKSLRERWVAHLDSTLFRPILLIDEAQQMQLEVLSELRLLASGSFDSKNYLTVILAGDNRLTARFSDSELVPLGSRIRTRLILDYATPDELLATLKHALQEAGNLQLIAPALLQTLVDHAAGNFRVLMNQCSELLLAAMELEQTQIDEKLFLELYQERASATRAKSKARK